MAYDQAIYIYIIIYVPYIYIHTFSWIFVFYLVEVLEFKFGLLPIAGLLDVQGFEGITWRP